MAKTIQWTEIFEEEVLNEQAGDIFLAVRPGTLYFDTKYFKKGDVVDIRIGNKVVRKAVLKEDLTLKKIKDFTQGDYNLLKKAINSPEKLKKFLSERYNICVDDESVVTLVFYCNMNLVHLKENEDPHFC